MSLATLLRRLRALVTPSRMHRDVEDEMRLHLELRQERLRQRGLSPADAREAARRRFGSLLRLREESRDSWGWRWLEQLLQDLRFAARTLVTHPGFTAAAVATLGLGIGANTAIFSILDGVVLKPLPYTNGERLMTILQRQPSGGLVNAGLSIREFDDYHAQATSFDALVEYHQMFFDLLRRGAPDRVNVGVVSHDFFDVLGIRPLLGRSFRLADDTRGADAVLILGYSYWMEKFGGDPRVVGQVFEMNDRPHTVVGVLPNVPHYPQENDVYMPVASCPFRARGELNLTGERREFSLLTAFGRLTPGVTAEAAAGEIDVICRRFTSADSATYPPESGFVATASTVREELVRNAQPLVLLLLGTTALVLLTACANVANLMLARILRRDREFSLREALGAGRARLVRQLLTESLLLGVVAGVVGLMLAASSMSLLTAVVGRFLPRAAEIGIDGRVLLFTSVTSLATGIAFGTFPALTSRHDVGMVMRTGRTVETTTRWRLQRALVVAQVTLSVVLLSTAALLLVSFYRLQQVDLGVELERVVAAEAYTTFARARYETREQFLGFYESVADRLRAEPGVVAAAVASSIPLGSSQPLVAYRTEGGAPFDPASRIGLAIVTPGFFDTLSIPILEGRGFEDRDGDGAPLAAVINQSLARRWNGRSPIGARIAIGGPAQPWRTIVGVTGDVAQLSLESGTQPYLYVPLRQSRQGFEAKVLVRTAGDASAGAAAITAAVHGLDPDMPVENVTTLAEARIGRLSRPLVTATLLTLFALLALVVTMTGIAGVMAMHVARRLGEFALRIALGATRPQILRPIVREGFGLIAGGLVLGIAAAAVLTPWLSSNLFDTAPADPATFAVVMLALLGAGGLACVGPAWRATRVNPSTVLNDE